MKLGGIHLHEPAKFYCIYISYRRGNNGKIIHDCIIDYGLSVPVVDNTAIRPNDLRKHSILHCQRFILARNYLQVKKLDNYDEDGKKEDEPYY